KGKDFIGNIDATNPKEHIICRCETVTEEEIVDALTREIKIDSIDAIKRRTRAGMGTCQGAFCGPRVRKLIAKTLNISEDEVKGVAPRSSDLHNRVKRIEIMKL
ncbi:MAG: (2Fe-2S)-binding protein, partial [Clostridium baratii]|nr:(2Fe-2S)-binding protein [Clostridium baratii]